MTLGFDRKVPVSPAFLQELEENDIRKIDYLDWAEDMIILHGTQDEIVPIKDTEDFCEENLIEFIPVEGADHRVRSQRAMDQASKAILDFFDLKQKQPDPFGIGLFCCVTILTAGRRPKSASGRCFSPHLPAAVCGHSPGSG